MNSEDNFTVDQEKDGAAARREYYRQLRNKNIDKFRSREKAYRDSHREQVKAANKRYWVNKALKEQKAAEQTKGDDK